MPRWSVVVVCGLYLTAACSGSSDPSETAPESALVASVDAYLAPYVDGRHYAGTVLLARGDQVLLSKGYGLANVEHGVANRPETRFQIGSLSKAFTAAAILLLQEEGRLHVDDPVARHLPDFPNGERITLHQLLVHTSGLTRFVFQPDYRERTLKHHQAADLVDWIAAQPLAFTPGERSGYSNANYAVLAHIVEQVTGQPFEDALATRVLDPLDLEATGHRGDTRTLVPNLARSFVPVDVDGLIRSAWFDYSIFTGAGSLYSTTEDLFRWHRGLSEGQLLGPTSLEAMYTDHADGRGYGWQREEWLGRETIAYSGWDGVGFSAHFLHYPEEQVTVIVLCNLNISGITGEIARNLSAIVLGEPVQNLELADASADRPVDANAAGVYRFGEDFFVPNTTMRIVDAEGRLFVDADRPEYRSALLRLADDEYLHRLHWTRIRFEREPDGSVVGMRYGPFQARLED